MRGFGKRKFSEPTFNFSRFLISKVFKHNVGNACAFVTRSMLIHMKLHIKGKLVVCFSISPINVDGNLNEGFVPYFTAN